MNNWYEKWDRFVSLLFPPRCVICGEVVVYEDWHCPSCSVQTSHWTGRAGEVEATAPFAYEGRMKNPVLAMKQSRVKRPYQFFAFHMAPLVCDAWGDTLDCLTSVPSNPSRMKERGHNQAQLLAVHLGRELGLPVKDDYLRRSDYTATQHELSAKERRANAERWYSLTPGADVRGKRILIVDDIITTGATIGACAGLLMRAGADEVRGVAATRTPPPRMRASESKV